MPVVRPLKNRAGSSGIGLPDPRWIAAVTAMIVPKPGRSLSEIEVLDVCRSRLAGFKVPKKVVFLDALPRNASGKALRRDLRLRLLEGSSV